MVALLRVGAELRDARVAAGLTLDAVGRAVGASASTISRLERGRARSVSVSRLVQVAAVVGLDLWIRTYPGPDPLRDAGHNRLEGAFRRRLGRGLATRTEVPIGDARDQRAWDMALADATERRAGVEFDTRLTDGQAYLRRIALKRRDSDVDRVLIVLLDTRSNRVALAAAASAFQDTFDLDDRSAWQALHAGRLPDRDTVLFLKVDRGQRR